MTISFCIFILKLCIINLNSILYSIENFILVLSGFITNFSPFLNSDAILNSDVEQFKSFMSFTNRTVIFMFGLNITANIYMFTNKNKMSSASVLTLYPLGKLYFSIIINLFIIITTLYTSHFNLMYGKNFSNYTMSFFMFITSSLFTISFIVFIETLFNLIRSFNLKMVLKNANKTINKSINYSLFRVLIIDYRVFKNWVNTFEHTDNNNISDVRTVKSLDNKPVNKNIMSYKIEVSLYFLKSLIRALKTTENIANLQFKRHHTVSSREAINLAKSIEIYSQQLKYLIEQNSKINTRVVIEDYANTMSNFYTMLSNLKYPNERNNNQLVELFNSTLENHSSLILSTFKNNEHKSEGKVLLNTFFNALKLTKDEHSYFGLSQSEFNDRLETLYVCYFEHTYRLIINLIEMNDNEVSELVLNNELFINTFLDRGIELNNLININTIHLSSVEIENYSLQGKKKLDFNKSLEDLFMAVLLYMVDSKKTNLISSITSILMTISSKIGSKEDNTNNEFSVEDESVLTEDKNTPINSSIPETNKNELFSDSLIEVFVFSIIKSNELEDYKSAGYLIKILSSNVTSSKLFSIIVEFIIPTINNKNIKYNTSNKIMFFNSFTFDYCLSKSLVLLLAQYLLIDPHLLNLVDLKRIRTKRLNSYKDYVYFLDKLELRQKDYNMISLSSENIEDYKQKIKNSNKKNYIFSLI